MSLINNPDKAGFLEYSNRFPNWLPQLVQVFSIDPLITLRGDFNVNPTNNNN